MVARQPLLLLLAAAALHHCGADAPDTRQCCRDAGVSDFCVANLCDVARPPDDVNVFEVAARCPPFLLDAARCLADARNHLPCCRRDAERPEFDDCFVLCDAGERAANQSLQAWDNNFKFCMSLNVRPIFACIREGYGASPGPPRHVSSVVTSATSSSIHWKPPTKLPAAAEEYEILYRPVDADASYTKSVTTSGTNVQLDELLPDTKYLAFVLSRSADEQRLSLKSEPTYFVTKGVAPTLAAYNQRLLSMAETNVTLVCRIFVHGLQHQRLQIRWTKLSANGSFNPLRYSVSGHRKHGHVAYGAAMHRQPRVYVTALSIFKLGADDFGLYRCEAENAFGAGYAAVQLVERVDVPLPPRPPNTTACCERARVHADCMGGCRGGDRFNPSVFAAGRVCALDVPKMQACSVQGVDQGACCLRRRVPARCLPLCDGSAQPIGALALISCIRHTTDILACHLEARVAQPDIPTGLRVTEANARTTTLTWQACERAQVYQVYHKRRTAPEWSVAAVTRPRLTMARTSDVEQVIVVAANGSGRSGASRLLLVGADERPTRAQKRQRSSGLAVATLMGRRDGVETTVEK